MDVSEIRCENFFIFFIFLFSLRASTDCIYLLVWFTMCTKTNHLFYFSVKVLLSSLESGKNKNCHKLAAFCL